MTVLVAMPTPFKPSEYAVVQKAAAYLICKVTVINGTGKRYDPSMFQVSVQCDDARGR